MSTTTYWTVLIDGNPAPLTPPTMDSDEITLTLASALSAQQPDARVAAVRWTGGPGEWDRGHRIGEFRAGDLLPTDQWT
jgi:hypothetical protein